MKDATAETIEETYFDIHVRLETDPLLRSTLADLDYVFGTDLPAYKRDELLPALRNLAAYIYTLGQQHQIQSQLERLVREQ